MCRCFLCAWHFQEENIYRNVAFFLILRLRNLHGSTIGDWPNLGVLSGDNGRRFVHSDEEVTDRISGDATGLLSVKRDN